MQKSRKKLTEQLQQVATMDSDTETVWLSLLTKVDAEAAFCSMKMDAVVFKRECMGRRTCMGFIVVVAVHLSLMNTLQKHLGFVFGVWRNWVLLYLTPRGVKKD